MPQSVTPKTIIIAQAGEEPTHIPLGEHGGETTHGGETHAGVEHGAGSEHEAKSPLAEYPAWWYSIIGAFISIVLVGFAIFCRTKGLRKRNPSGRQSLIEQAVASITYFARNAIGEGGEKYAGLVGTVFAFVLLSNLMGVLPSVFKGGHEANSYHHLFPAPTANLSMTIAISLWVFFVVNWAGIKENGIGGWLKHFAGPIPAMSPLLFPIEFIGALVKPISLSIRLFGNVFGEETVIAVLVSLGAAFFLPVQFPMLMFGVFGGLVQAGVYTILTCAYIALSLGDHDDHGHGAEHDDIKDEFGAHVPSH